MLLWSGDAVASRQVRWLVSALGRLAAPRRPRPHHVQLVAVAVVAVFTVGSVAAVYQGMVLRPRLAAEMASSGGDAAAAPDTAQPVRKAAATVAPEPEAEPEPAAEQASAPVKRSPAPRRAAPAPPPLQVLPTGKGMWFHFLSQTSMSPKAVVRHARRAGLTHLYVRTGSSRSGFHGGPELDAILPVAHRAGLKVVGWDFPYLDDPVADAHRAARAVRYRTRGGHSIDAFTADIETGSEGVRLAADRVDRYGRELRSLVGERYPLIGTVPNACLNDTYPYAEVARWFDAMAPMVYWITRDPARDVACNMERLKALGRPVLPIGQAYDPAIDNPAMVGWVPSYADLDAFMDRAAAMGASGVSFWVWHTATPDMWQAIADSHHFTLAPLRAGARGPAVRVLQRALVAHGYGVPVDGRYGGATARAVRHVQVRLGLPASGHLTPATVQALTGPR